MVKALPIIASLLTAASSLSIESQSALAMEDNAASQLQACASIPNNIDRLGCYDKAFGGQHVATPATSPSPTSAPQTPAVTAKRPTNDGLMVSDDQVGWSNKETTSGLDNSKSETAILPAATAKISRFATSRLAQHAALVIRCREGKTDLFVAYTDIVDGMEHSISVQYRIGDSPVKTARWGISQDYQSYGTWQTAETLPLIRSLLNANELYIRGDAGSMGTSEALFKLAGIEGAIAPVRAACHW
ncbi:type VI secretion system-associated protein TagO [Bradyrhizobium sp. GCM10027634]|uniref:type VI secretion system-associated protein TagO n=1 Tax=unclassified Bradyrhizobium TaxID=2631580 RepID=UPI00263AF567|nr:type VI secretion system-associated protein TagO [Bradyrhizobium sp. WYCCWR 12677]MDN5001363.1 type VI secretion system-associated protein TagO [Bradyrhizobium sp. WYCCWR 12677]